VFAGWPRELPPEIEVCAVQLPGRQNRLSEPPVDQWLPLLDALDKALAPYLDLPFAVFGHSVGGLIGFEWSRRAYRERRLRPVCLFASACAAPHLARGDDPVHELPDEEFIARLQELGGLPEELMADPEMRAMLLPIMRADCKLSDTYPFKPAEALASPIFALGGEDDASVPRDRIEPWREHTAGTFALESVPGGHFFILEQPSPAVEIVRARLEP